MSSHLITADREHWAELVAWKLSEADGREWWVFYLDDDEAILRSTSGEDLRITWPASLSPGPAQIAITGYFDEIDPRHPLRKECPRLDAAVDSVPETLAAMIATKLLPTYRDLRSRLMERLGTSYVLHD